MKKHFKTILIESIKNERSGLQELYLYIKNCEEIVGERNSCQYDFLSSMWEKWWDSLIGMNAMYDSGMIDKRLFDTLQRKYIKKFVGNNKNDIEEIYNQMKRDMAENYDGLPSELKTSD